MIAQPSLLSTQDLNHRGDTEPRMLLSAETTAPARRSASPCLQGDSRGDALQTRPVHDPVRPGHLSHSGRLQAGGGGEQGDGSPDRNARAVPIVIALTPEEAQEMTAKADELMYIVLGGLDVLHSLCDRCPTRVSRIKVGCFIEAVRKLAKKIDRQRDKLRADFPPRKLDAIARDLAEQTRTIEALSAP
jgi:hypothetical protein